MIRARHQVRLPIAVAIVFAAAISPSWEAAAAPDEPRAADAGDYRIGIEDELRIFIWGESDLSLRVVVRPDGKITVPLVNDVAVVGLTTNQVRNRIAEALALYVREPTVSVIVEKINSYRIYFLGEIRRQGAMNFYRPIRLLQAVAAAGGLTEFSKKEIVLLREESGVERRIDIDYKRVVNGDSGTDNLFLKPGDTLLVK